MATRTRKEEWAGLVVILALVVVASVLGIGAWLPWLLVVLVVGGGGLAAWWSRR